MVEFQVIEWFTLTDRGEVAYVYLDRDTQDFFHLMGQQVLLDGVQHKVKGVERFLHLPPWRKGENIGLLVDMR